ncbi:5875_t:CDS:1, partial [Ambispora leptoticha]
DKEDIEVVESESEGNDTVGKTIKLESLVLSEGNNIAADETRKLESLVGMKNEGIQVIYPN